ncbi:hypothetical protein [Ereboglobus luteus]|uniref:hypothetical protein n=1 Tax=Ereboglobus luteus TaxID=1796921 RepID=UPI00126031B4|nr:hypothetical protein [Ereboglobus luteus]
MPASDATKSGAIGQRLARLRGDLADVRATIKRSLNNGATVNLQGNVTTEIALSRLKARESRITSAITDLEARLAGTTWMPKHGSPPTRRSNGDLSTKSPPPSKPPPAPAAHPTTSPSRCISCVRPRARANPTVA